MCQQKMTNTIWCDQPATERTISGHHYCLAHLAEHDATMATGLGVRLAQGDLYLAKSVEDYAKSAIKALSELVEAARNATEEVQP